MISILKCWPPLVAGVVSIVAVIAPVRSVAQDRNTETVRLPTDPDAWLNSPPISNEILDGKAAILYFFEEG